MRGRSLLFFLFGLVCWAPASFAAFSGGASSSADHILVIVMENKNIGEIVKGSDAPYFNGLRGGRLTNYWGLAHPSLPNYVGMIGAWPPLPNSDDPRIRIQGDSLPEELSLHHLSAGSYMQGLPRVGYGGRSYPRIFGRYVLKHDPFLLFSRIRESPLRNTVVPLAKLPADLKEHRLPNFSLIVPDLCHDMHGAFGCHFHNSHELIREGDQFLASWIPRILRSDFYKTHHVWIFVVWDESSGKGGHGGKSVLSPPGSNPQRMHAGGHIPILWLDSRNPRKWQSNCFGNHYSLLETVTRNFGLPSLTPPGERVPLPKEGMSCFQAMGKTSGRGR